MRVFRVPFLTAFVGWFFLCGMVFASYPSIAEEEVWRGNFLWMSSDLETGAEFAFDGDVFADIFIAASDGAYWYESDGGDNGMVLVTKIQDGPAGGYGANAIDVGYLDPDGHMDLLIGEERPTTYYSAPVRWYESDESNNSYTTIYSCGSTEFGTRPLGNGAGKSGLAIGSADGDEFMDYMLRRYNNTALKYESDADNSVTYLSQPFSASLGVEYTDFGSGVHRYLLTESSTQAKLNCYLTDETGFHFQNGISLPEPPDRAVSFVAGNFDQVGSYELFMVTNSGEVLQYSIVSPIYAAPMAELVGTVVSSGALSVGMGDIDGDTVVELLVGTRSGIDFYEPGISGVATYSSTMPLGFAVNDLAVAVPEFAGVPIGWVDTLKWTLGYTGGGGWGGPMVANILGRMASNTGLKQVYWDVYNYGFALYPSVVAADKVYNNCNSGYDFGSMDMPGLALASAAFNDLWIGLTVWWDGNCSADMIGELLVMYPEAEIIIIANGTPLDQIEGALSGVSLDRVTVGGVFGGGRTVDLLVSDYETLRDTYTYAGDVLFYRQIELPDVVNGCFVGLSAEQEYQLFVNGYLVASGEYDVERGRPDIYDIGAYIHGGTNEFCVVVASGSMAGGLLINIKVGDVIFGSDKDWQVRPVTSPLSETEVVAICSEPGGWSGPLVESGNGTWPRSVDPIRWSDWTLPEPEPSYYSATLFAVNMVDGLDVYGGGKIDPESGTRRYDMEWVDNPADYVYWVDTGDLDGDGLVEVVCSRTSDAGVGHLLRFEIDPCDGSLIPEGTISPPPWAYRDCTSLAIGDYDGDSYDDLITIFQNNGWTYWHEAVADSAPFAMAQVGERILGTNAICAVIGDMDGQGGKVLLISIGTGLHWRESDGNNSDSWVESVYSEGFWNIQSMCMGDLDGDDETDLIWVRDGVDLGDGVGCDGVIEWMEMDGGVFPPTFRARVNWETDFSSVDLGDADGDGRVEIVAAKGDGTVRWFSPVRVDVPDSQGVPRGVLGAKPFESFANNNGLSRVALVSSLSPPCDLGMNDADLNCDCVVNILDLYYLANQWLGGAYHEGGYVESLLGDLDYSGNVDLFDYAVFSEKWLNCSKSEGCQE